MNPGGGDDAGYLSADYWAALSSQFPDPWEIQAPTEIIDVAEKESNQTAERLDIAAKAQEDQLTRWLRSHGRGAGSSANRRAAISFIRDQDQSLFEWLSSDQQKEYVTLAGKRLELLERIPGLEAMEAKEGRAQEGIICQRLRKLEYEASEKQRILNLELLSKEDAKEYRRLQAELQKINKEIRGHEELIAQLATEADKLRDSLGQLDVKVANQKAILMQKD